MEKLLNFSLDDIKMYQDDDDQDFAIVKLSFLASGNNSHHNPIDEDILKANANSVLGKFIIGKYDEFKQDTRGHENKEFIYGYVPPNSKVTFEEKDNRLFATVDGVLSKLYATEIVEMFRKYNNRSVSCEFTANMKFEEDKLPMGADNPILSFTIRAITILGKGINPSCKGANMSIIKFSQQDAEKYYNSKTDSLTELYKFSKKRKEEMMAQSIKVNKTELKDTPWGDINKTELKDKVMEASNRDTIVKDIYMLVEDGWQDAPSEHLKYPVMEIIGNTAYYNRYGLASALAYAKKEGENSVVNKVEKLYKKFKIDDEKGEKKEMESKKFESSELEGRPLWAEVIKRIHEKLGDHLYVEGIYSDKVVVRNEKTKELMDIPAKIKLGKDDEEMSIDIDYDKMKKSEVQKDFAEVKKMDDDKEYPEDDTHSTDKKDDGEVEKDDEDTEKKMSLDANVDMAAYYEMLQNETDEYKTLAKKVLEEENRGLVMQDVLKMAKERDELKAFYDKKMAEEKECEFAKVMSEVKNDLTDKEFEDLKCEFENCEDITAFANKARAMAYVSKKKNATPNDGEVKKFARMDFDFSTYAHQLNTVTADDVFKKYL